MGRRRFLYTSLLSGLLLIAGATPAKAEDLSCDAGARMPFARGLSCEDQRLLAEDLARLRDFVPHYPSPEAYAALGTLDLSGNILVHWLFDRLPPVERLSTYGARPGDSLRRLGSLFHLALHAGAGEPGHRHCPASGDYAGHSVCDAAGSAAYRVEGLMLRELLKSCADCTIEDRESLRLEIADRLLRAENE